MSPESQHLTSLDLDVLCLARPDAAEAPSLGAHLDTCPACREKRQERQAVADHFARDLLPRSLPLVRQRLTRRRGWTLGRWALVLSPVACGALLALFVLRESPQQAAHEQSTASTDTGDLGIKGDNVLVTYARQGNKIKRLTNGSVVAAGDALRFVVETGNNQYLLIAGMDGAGHAIAYFPYAEWRSMPVTPHTRFEVPGSLVLDDARGPERIVALLSPRPLAGDAVRPILSELAQRGPQAVRAAIVPGVAGAATSSILLEKRE